MKNEKHFLDNVKWGVIPIVNYRGCYVTKLSNGLFKIFGRTGVSADGVDEIIDESLEGLKNSLKSDETGIISTLG